MLNTLKSQRVWEKKKEEKSLPNDSTTLNTTPSSTSWTFSSTVISTSGTSGRSWKYIYF